MKILHVLGDLEPGGIQSFLDNIYSKIDNQKFLFDFVVHSKKESYLTKKFREKNCQIFVCPKFTPLSFLSYQKWWRNFFNNHKDYSVVHGHMRSTAFIYLAEAKKHGIPTIFHSHSTSNGHGFPAFVKDALQKKALRYSDYFFACSYNAGLWLFGDDNVKKPNFYLVPNGIDISKFLFTEEKRDEIRKTLGISEEEVVYGNVGRLAEAKNQAFLIDVFSEISKEKKNSRLIIVGDGPEKEKIEKKITKENLQNKVSLTGSTNFPELFYQAMDCFIFPSKWEGFGMAPIEAQASGLQCYISSSCPDSVFITERAKKISINDSSSAWAKTILTNMKEGANRALSLKERKDLSKFDIETTSSFISDFYSSLEMKKKREN